MALFFSQNRRRKKNQTRGNYAFRRKMAVRTEIHRLDLNPETDASRKARLRKNAGIGARWAFGILAAILFMALMKVVMMEAFVNNTKFRLQKIEVLTDGPVSEQAITEASGLKVGDNMLMVSLREVRDKVEALPGVKEAKVSRQFPSVIQIKVGQRSPVAWIECPAKRIVAGDLRYGCLLDGQGFVLPSSSHTEAAAAGLPVIKVSDLETAAPNKIVASPAALRALNLLAACAGSPLKSAANPVHVDASREHMLVVDYPGGLEVTLPAQGPYAAELTRLKQALDEADRRQWHLATVNLLVKHNVPVTLRTTPSAARPARTVAQTH